MILRQEKFMIHNMKLICHNEVSHFFGDHVNELKTSLIKYIKKELGSSNKLVSCSES